MQDNGTVPQRRAVIITRPARAAARTARQLRDRGVEDAAIVVSPLLRIAATGSPIDVSLFRGVILTSENGAAAAPPPAAGMKAWCVGEGTAAAARRKGYAAIAADGNAESLIDLLLTERPAGQLAWLRGKHVAVDLEPVLRAQGAQVRSFTVYEQIPCRLNARAADALRSAGCVVPLFSARAATVFSGAAKQLPDLGHEIFCLSRRVADAVRLDWNCVVARSADQLISQTARAALCAAIEPAPGEQRERIQPESSNGVPPVQSRSPRPRF